MAGNGQQQMTRGGGPQGLIACFWGPWLSRCVVPRDVSLLPPCAQSVAYALVCETLKYKPVIDEVLELAGLTSLVKVSHFFCRILRLC